MARSAPLGTLWAGARTVIPKQPNACSEGMGQIWAIGDLQLLVSRTQDRILRFTDGHLGQFFMNFQNMKSDLTKFSYFFVNNWGENFYIAPNAHFRSTLCPR